MTTQADEQGKTEAIAVQDARMLAESLIHFGRSHDGAVESDLRRAIDLLQAKAKAFDEIVALKDKLLNDEALGHSIRREPSRLAKLEGKERGS